jgi:hypothetical protein
MGVKGTVADLLSLWRKNTLSINQLGEPHKNRRGRARECKYSLFVPCGKLCG